MRINLSTRLLHFCMVVVVAYQMISSVLMVAPEPGKMTGIDTTLFYLHVTVFGWAAVIFSGVYAMTRFYEPDAWGRLVPWFSSKYRHAFFKSASKELPGIFRGRLAPPEAKGALAGSVHGLGFLYCSVWVFLVSMCWLAYVLMGVWPMTRYIARFSSALWRICLDFSRRTYRYDALSPAYWST